MFKLTEEGILVLIESEGAINQSSVEKLTQKQETLQFQIEVDVDNIQGEFAALQTTIRRSLRETVSVTDVVAHVIGYGVLEGDKEKLEEKKSLDEVFNLLTKYWSFLDCLLLRSIVEMYGSDEDHKRMAEYQEKLQNFCNKRVSEIPKETLLLNNSSVAQIQSNACMQMTVKLNMSDPRLSAIKEIKKNICKILKVSPAKMVIKEIKEGCVEVTYFILESVSEVLNKPLTKDQCDEFRAA